MSTAVSRWREQLEAWAIPEEILAAAPESPYGFPTELFRHRAEVATGAEPSPSARRAWDALPEGGTVLDVGVGGGAASLPLAPRASLITGVDQSQDMLDAFRDAARAAGVESRSVRGSWPDVAAEVEQVDVVVCNHVLYNVQRLEPFITELSAHTRARVVVGITDRHPWAWMNDLWLRFHSLERPSGPTADDALEALREMGLRAEREDFIVPAGRGGFERRENALALIRRRLCLPSDRDPEITDALGDRLAGRDGLWSAGPLEQSLVTLWWNHTGGPASEGLRKAASYKAL